MAAEDHHHHHDHHGHVHLAEADWAAWADHSQLEGEVLLAFVTDTAARVAELRGPEAPPVRRVVDIGSGPGVGTCELARLFPDAQVVAVDGSPAMLERVEQRAAASGLDGRVSTHLAELPTSLDDLGRADVVWASLSLHHVGDEVAALRLLRGLLEPDGLLAVAEMADPVRVLPDDVGIGPPGLADRLATEGAAWFTDMRSGLPGFVPSRDLPTMLADAGLDVIESRLARLRLDSPLGDDERRLVTEHLQRVRHQLADRLDDDDLSALDVLNDADDPRGAAQRSDLFIEASRQIVIVRPTAGG